MNEDDAQLTLFKMRKPRMTAEERAERKRCKRMALVALGLAKPPREPADPSSLSLSVNQRRLLNGNSYFYEKVDMDRARKMFGTGLNRLVATLVDRAMLVRADGELLLTDKGRMARRLSGWADASWNGRADGWTG